MRSSFRVLLTLRSSRGHFFLAVFFRVTHYGFSERLASLRLMKILENFHMQWVDYCIYVWNKNLHLCVVQVEAQLIIIFIFFSSAPDRKELNVSRAGLGCLDLFNLRASNATTGCAKWRKYVTQVSTEICHASVMLCTKIQYCTIIWF